MQLRVTLTAKSRQAIIDLDRWRKTSIPQGAAFITKAVATQFRDGARNKVRTRSRFHGYKPGTLETGITMRAGQMNNRVRQYFINASAVSGRFDYARAVEEGTKPHDIRMPVNSKGDVMATGWRGNVPKGRYGGYRKHRHPGSMPMRYMRDTFDETVRKGNEYVNQLSRFIGTPGRR